MVSAVFHSPLEQARADKAAGLTPHTGAAPRKAGAASSPATTASVPSRSSSSALRDALQQAHAAQRRQHGQPEGVPTLARVAARGWAGRP